ncbi:RNA polymerase sigma factor [Cellulomonas edaphi]|uniref:Sigma-70 family RNA polymerase sigma factor n=1 Tax=Cellulomonas edaphi TaxID=3053468 RepID=A0ABT7S685_9CELL|nr:sigma-70 family RNA polymerase sigma factor [Cellulomons edaphi]MDM7831135.1 sigma-70 family RNA polymerase sigma factor [Cellulomons edaphi]
MDQPFERVVQQHGATVLRVCRAVLGPADADDAWQETFLAALRAWPDLDPRANVQAWLVTIAHRKAVDVVRRAQRHAVPVAEVPDVVAAPDGRDLDLWAALAGLPHKQRHAVALHHLGGLPYDEVAGVLGGTAAAARRAGADGVAALRRTYGATSPGSTAAPELAAPRTAVPRAAVPRAAVPRAEVPRAARAATTNEGVGA